MKAIIIDDEPDCVSILTLQLQMFCPQVQVVAECTSGEEGLEAIRIHDPQLVFLDIEMPNMNGFQLLESLETINFSVIFVTAYDKFAVKAFRFSAIDYLLKPTDPKDLIISVERAERSFKLHTRQLEMLKQQMIAGPAQVFPEKIALPYANGVVFVDLKNILYCQADDNYTFFHLVNGQKHLVSKTLRNIQETLPENIFLRVHRQYLVNLDHAAKFTKSEGNYLIMTNGFQVPVARSQKDRLIERFGWL